MPELWTEKFFPATLEEFIGNSEIVSEAEKWASAWKQGKKQKPLLLWGYPGVGKTCLALLIAKLKNWGVFELNSSAFRNKDIIERVAGAAAMNASFSGEKRLILFDEVDGLSSSDRGGAGAMLSIIKETQNPVILTANDIYSDKRLAPFRVAATPLEFKKINYLSIAKRLREILQLEGAEFEEEAVKQLAKSSEGDFRSALLDAQFLSVGGKITLPSLDALGGRERQEKIFKVLFKIFKGKDFEEIRKSRFAAEVSDDLLSAWIEENIARQFTGNDVAAAFDALSRADIFEGRIMRRQHYGFKRYSSDLMSAGVGLSRAKEYHSFTPFQFPTILSMLSRSIALRAMKKELAKKIGKQTHSSSREVMAYDFPFFRQVLEDKEKMVEFAAQFELDENEVAFMLNSKPETKKVQSLLLEAQQLRAKELAPKKVPPAVASKQSGEAGKDSRQARLF